MDPKAYIFVPAGTRPMAGDPAGRPEYIARQDWVHMYGGDEAREAGIGFGFELKGDLKNFDPKMLRGIPYAIHAPNEDLTRLYMEEQKGDTEWVGGFWARMHAWTKLDPQPIYVVFHGGGLGEVPPIDKRRFELTIEPAEWLRRAGWHERTFRRIRELGIPARLETVYLTNYYGPPYAKGWLPVTYTSPRVGIYKDMLGITHAAGIGSVVDFEHLQMTAQSLIDDSPELQAKEMWDSRNKPLRANLLDPDDEFYRYFGFEAGKGKRCRIWIPPDLDVLSIEPELTWYDLWRRLVDALGTTVYHVGGISLSQVVNVSEVEAQNSGYHAELAELYKDDPYALSLVTRRRGGSHAPVQRDDAMLKKMLGHTLGIARTQGKSPIFVLETSNKGEVKPDYWYWTSPSALEDSLVALQSMLTEMV